MSVCAKFMAIKSICGLIAGGIDRAWIFDPKDFDFTQAEAVAGVMPPYTAVALAEGAVAANGAYLYRVEFEDEKGNYTGSKSDNESRRSVRYEHRLTLPLAGISHTITNFLQMLDTAATCCGVGVIFKMNNGKILVAGEQIVNGEEIESKRMRMRHGPTELNSGTALEDDNVANVVLIGNLQRPLYEYTGTVATLTALEEPAPVAP